MFQDQIDTIKNFPIYRAINQKSFQPLKDQFARKNMTNFTNAMTGAAFGMSMGGGFNKLNPKLQPFNKNTPYFNLSPKSGTMLNTYARENPGFNPTFKYSNGWGIFNNTRPENIRALAASYLSRINK